MTLIELLREAIFVWQYSYTENQVKIEKRLGYGFEISFYLHYRRNVMNYSSADYENPEEGDVVFDPQYIDTIEIGFNQEMHVPSPYDMRHIETLLYCKIFDK